MRERTLFIETYLTGLYTITELAERFGIWSGYYGAVLLASFDEREMKFYGRSRDV